MTDMSAEDGSPGRIEAIYGLIYFAMPGPQAEAELATWGLRSLM